MGLRHSFSDRTGQVGFNFLNITLTGQYTAPCSLAHNAHVRGDSVYISYYESGVRVIDISNRAVPVEVAYYDTYAQSDNGQFYGCWGTFPFTQNGYIYASNIEGRMQIFKFTTVTTTENGTSPGGGNAWPNPASGKVNFEFPFDGNHSFVTISDAMGKEIAVISNLNFSENKITGEWNSNPAAGIYFLKYGNYSLRIVVE